MSKMMSMNVNVEGGGGGKAALFVKAIRVVQDRVKHHTEIRQKWLDVIEAVQEVTLFPLEGGQMLKDLLQACPIEGCNQTGKYDITLKVQAATTKHSTNRISIFKVDTTPAPDGQSIKTGQASCSGDQNIFIEVPNNFIKQETLGAALVFFFLFIQSPLLDKPGEAVVLLVVTLLVVTLIFVATCGGVDFRRRLRMKGTKHSGDSLQLTSNSLGLLLFGSMALPGAHAQEFNNDTCLIDGANAVVDGNVLEEGDNFKVVALALTVLVVGGASLWIVLKSLPKFQIDRGLEQSPLPTKSNPVFEIHPMVECEEALMN